jgi:orotidine-5'-phosphate decarboxylase
MRMSFNDRVRQAVRRGHVCVGLDPVPQNLPEGVSPDREGIGRYLGALIEATSPYAVAYKPNCAFYEALGPWGWEILESLREVVPSEALFILDAKRGDVGHTAARSAHMAFARIGADAITLSGYLGADSLEPFLSDPDRGAFLLCLTSNPGARIWQTARLDGTPLFLRMASWAQEQNANDNVGLVVGATQAEEIGAINKASGGLPLLIPGVGAQGGDLEAAVRYAREAPFLINASRSICGASRGRDFADAAAQATSNLHEAIVKAENALVGS